MTTSAQRTAQLDAGYAIARLALPWAMRSEYGYGYHELLRVLKYGYDLQVLGVRAGFPLKSKQGFPGEALLEFTGGFGYWFLLIKKRVRGPDAVFSDMPTLDKLAYIDWMRGKMLEIVRREFAAVTDGTLRFHLRRFLRAWFAYSGMMRRWYEGELFMEL